MRAAPFRLRIPNHVLRGARTPVPPQTEDPSLEDLSHRTTIAGDPHTIRADSHDADSSRPTPADHRRDDAECHLDPRPAYRALPRAGQLRWTSLRGAPVAGALSRQNAAHLRRFVRCQRSSALRENARGFFASRWTSRAPSELVAGFHVDVLRPHDQF